MPGEKTFSFEEVLDAADMTTYFVQQAVLIKAVDESVTSSITLQDDNELQITVDANTRYFVEVFLIYAADPAADIKAAFTAPASAAFAWVSDTIVNTATSTVDTVSRTAQTISSSAPAIGGITDNTTNMVAPIKGILTVGATAGVFTLQWAQNASNAAATYVRANSTMILTRVT